MDAAICLHRRSPYIALSPIGPHCVPMGLNPSACLSFWVLRAVGPLPPSVIKCCSAEVNSASAKVLPAAKHPHGALVPPARRPVGWFPHTFSGFQNIDMNAPSKEKVIRIGCPSLSFCPPEAAQAASLLWRNFLDKRGRTL